MEARKSRTLLFIRVQRLFPDGFVSYFPRDRRESFCTVCVSFALENAHNSRPPGDRDVSAFSGWPQPMPSSGGRWPAGADELSAPAVLLRIVFTAAPARTG